MTNTQMILSENGTYLLFCKDPNQRLTQEEERRRRQRWLRHRRHLVAEDWGWGLTWHVILHVQFNCVIGVALAVFAPSTHLTVNWHQWKCFLMSLMCVLDDILLSKQNYKIIRRNNFHLSCLYKIISVLCSQTNQSCCTRNDIISHPPLLMHLKNKYY